MIRFAAIGGLGVSLALGASVSAATQVTTFDAPFATGSRYAGFSGAGALTFNATNVQARSTGFGGFFHDLPALSVNGSAENAIEFDFTVNAGDTPTIVAVLGDTDFTEYGYRFFSSGPGNYTATIPLSPVPSEVTGVGNSFVSGAGAVEGLFTEDIDYIHIQIDAHGSSVPYDVTFNNLRLVSVPEPTTLAAVGLAGALLGRRRRSI